MFDDRVSLREDAGKTGGKTMMMGILIVTAVMMPTMPLLILMILFPLRSFDLTREDVVVFCTGFAGAWLGLVPFLGHVPQEPSGGDIFVFGVLGLIFGFCSTVICLDLREGISNWSKCTRFVARIARRQRSAARLAIGYARYLRARRRGFESRRA